MTEPALSFEHVDKVYRLGSERANLIAAIPGPFGRRAPANGHWALRDLNFEIMPGEIVGIIGPNGAGKSTLLKLIARVVAPTRGRLTINGSVASLIELGVGFHPDLTGAENVRFSAAVLGMSRSEVESRYDEIVEFAGIERFMGTPVKRYSSGMLARLGFAVASNVNADVILIDEVLSVGDADFQRKSFERMKLLQESGSTVLLVTHNLFIVPEICQRAIRLEKGTIVDSGDPREVVDRYLAAEATRTTESDDGSGADVKITSVHVDPHGLNPGGDLSVSLVLDVGRPLPNAFLTIVIAAPSGRHAAGTDIVGSAEAMSKPGRYQVRGVVRDVRVVPGDYRIFFTAVQRVHQAPITLDQVVGNIQINAPEDIPQYGDSYLDCTWSVTQA